MNVFMVGAMNSDRANLDGCGFSKFKVLLIICEFTATECSWSIADFVYQYYFFSQNVCRKSRPCNPAYKARNNNTCILFITCTVRILTFFVSVKYVEIIVLRLFTLMKPRLALKFYLKVKSLWSLKVKTIAAAVTDLKVT